jgi:hypothetical protein
MLRSENKNCPDWKNLPGEVRPLFENTRNTRPKDKLRPKEKTRPKEKNATQTEYATKRKCTNDRIEIKLIIAVRNLENFNTNIND